METLKQFADELKERREFLEITLTDIFDKTRIDKKYLEAMENSDFDIMPQVYMRAFIRKYAEAVELDPNQIILKYDAARSGKVFEDVSKHAEQDDNVDEEEKPISPDKSSNTNTKYLIIVFAIVIVLAGIFYAVFINSGSNEIIVEKAIEDIIDERSENEPERFEFKNTDKDIPSPSENNTVASDSLSLKIYAVDTVWVQLLIDNSTKAEYILYPTRSKTLKAKSQIDILVGNSAGVEFILNGKKVEFSGKKGEIKSLIFDENGIRYPQKSINKNE